MSARRPKLCRVVTGALASAVAVALTASGTVTGTESPTPSTLDRPIADLAIIEGDGPAALPRLLTLDTIEQPPGTVRVALLDRNRSSGWQPTRSERVFLLDPADAPETPWLIELERNHFVILATSHDRAKTTVVPILVDIGGAGSLEVGTPTRVAMAVDDAGAVDVDGDGSIELVVSSSRRPSRCAAEGPARARPSACSTGRRSHSVPSGPSRTSAWLAGFSANGTVGRGAISWPMRTGTVPPAPTRPNASASWRSAWQTRRIAAISPEEPGALISLPGAPIVADFDGDGRDEAVVRDGAALTVLDPARGWTRTRVATGDVLPIAASDRDTGSEGRSGILAWRDAETGPDIVLNRVARAEDGAFALTEQRLDLVEVAPTRRSRALESIRDVTAAQLAP